MFCPIATALLHNVLFIKRKKIVKCTYTHTHTHTTLISQIFSFKQKLRKFPYKNFSFQYNKIVKLMR